MRARDDPTALGPGIASSLCAMPRGVVLIGLPGLSGIEILVLLRDWEGAPPAIVMTGFDQTGTRETCLAAGAVDYVTKSIEGVRLSDAISQALGQS